MNTYKITFRAVNCESWTKVNATTPAIAIDTVLLMRGSFCKILNVKKISK